MTCSTRCSSSRAAGLAALLAAAIAGVGGCAHRGEAEGVGALAEGGRERILVLPVDNASGGAAPTKELGLAVEQALRGRHEVIGGDALEQFLARHRTRYTGGIDAETARAAKAELGADAVLLTSLEQYRPAGPPTVGLAMRLVSTDGEEPVILWMDAASFAGDQAPGLLRLGVVDSLQEVQGRVLAKLSSSLFAFLDGRAPAAPSCGGAWYGPKVRFRSPRLDGGTGTTVAVVPFLNNSRRRGAGDALALEFVRHMVASGRFRVIEPGVVRDYLLRARVIMPGGVSLEATRLMIGALGAELVMSGVVFDFDETPGVQGPAVRFTVNMLDGGSGEVVWHSSSFNRGDDGVFAFGLGRVATSGELSCRMVGDVVRALPRREGTTPRVLDDVARFSIGAQARTPPVDGRRDGRRRGDGAGEAGTEAQP